MLSSALLHAAFIDLPLTFKGVCVCVCLRVCVRVHMQMCVTPQATHLHQMYTVDKVNTAEIETRNSLMYSDRFLKTIKTFTPFFI